MGLTVASAPESAAQLVKARLPTLRDLIEPDRSGGPSWLVRSGDPARAARGLETAAGHMVYTFDARELVRDAEKASPEPVSWR